MNDSHMTYNQQNHYQKPCNVVMNHLHTWSAPTIGLYYLDNCAYMLLCYFQQQNRRIALRNWVQMLWHMCVCQKLHIRPTGRLPH